MLSFANDLEIEIEPQGKCSVLSRRIHFNLKTKMI
jgi:hypothetical protein